MSDYEFGLKAQKHIAQGNTLGFLMLLHLNALKGQKRYSQLQLRFCPFRAFSLPMLTNPGCRFALPWAMRSLPFQGVLNSFNFFNSLTP